MTRETKLGLLIGTGIILLIGIVVSDQLSVVKRHEPPPVTTFGLDTGGGAQGPMPTPGVFIQEPGATGAIGGLANPLQPAGDADVTPNHRAMYEQPLPGAAMAQRGSEPVPAVSITEQTLRSTSAGGGSRIAAPGGEQAIGLFDAAPLPPRSAAEIGAPVNATGPIGSEPRTAARTISVQSGDTLEKLARVHMGDGRLWPELLKANSDLVKRPQDLRIGMALRIPDVASAATSQGPVSTRQQDDGSAPGGRAYVVQKGDTLYGIARQTLGNGARWKEILKANSKLLNGSAANLKPGMKLTIPASPPGGITRGHNESGAVSTEHAMAVQGVGLAPANPLGGSPVPLLLDEPVGGPVG